LINLRHQFSANIKSLRGFDSLIIIMKEFLIKETFFSYK
jgi:hypothetical protein